MPIAPSSDLNLNTVTAKSDCSDNNTANVNTENSDNQKLQNLLEKSLPFIRGELHKIDSNLPSLMALLCSVGASECFHKHGSFLDHLFGTYRILKHWGAPNYVCLFGLFHSSYSNSYVNLAIFDPSTSRDTVRSYVGVLAEHLIHLFCVIPRHPFVYDNLVYHYTDSELVDHLNMSDVSLRNMRDQKGYLSSKEESWRKKINSLVPYEGLVVKHIRTGEDVRLSRRIVAVFLLVTIADTSEQAFSYQDVLFENSNGRREFTGNNFQALWPGDGKPGLWNNAMSRIAAVYNLIVREEEIMMLERKRDNANNEVVMEGRDEDIELVIPPVFDRCTTVLNAGQQIEARDLYWEVVYESDKIGLDKAEEVLLESIEKNPFVGEPHIVLAQLYLGKNKFEEAKIEAEKGLMLLLEWGCPWDKRMSWEGWIALARVLLMNSKKRSWPRTAFGIINLGLVS